jgi:hypothetical protein
MVAADVKREGGVRVHLIKKIRYSRGNIKRSWKENVVLQNDTIV